MGDYDREKYGVFKLDLPQDEYGGESHSITVRPDGIRDGAVIVIHDAEGRDIAKLRASDSQLSHLASMLTEAWSHRTTHGLTSRVPWWIDYGGTINVRGVGDSDTEPVQTGLPLLLLALAQGDIKHSDFISRFKHATSSHFSDVVGEDGEVKPGMQDEFDAVLEAAVRYVT